MIKIKRMIKKLNRLGSLPKPILWKKNYREGMVGQGLEPGGSFLRFLGFTSRQAPSQVAPPVAPSPVECSPEVAAPIEKN